jgi:hypothetical protein
MLSTSPTCILNSNLKLEKLNLKLFFKNLQLEKSNLALEKSDLKLQKLKLKHLKHINFFLKLKFEIKKLPHV